MEDYQKLLEKSERKVFLPSIIGIIAITILGSAYTMNENVSNLVDKITSFAVFMIAIVVIAIMAAIFTKMKKIALARICIAILIVSAMLYECSSREKVGIEVRIIAAAIMTAMLFIGKILEKILENFDEKVFFCVIVAIATLVLVFFWKVKQGLFILFALLACNEKRHIKRACEKAIGKENGNEIEEDLLWEAFIFTWMSIIMYGSALKLISLL